MKVSEETYRKLEELVRYVQVPWYLDLYAGGPLFLNGQHRHFRTEGHATMEELQKLDDALFQARAALTTIMAMAMRGEFKLKEPVEVGSESDK